MAISNYTELQAAIADWLNRGDLTSQIPNFIALTETEANRVLRTRAMLARPAAVTLSDRFTALPEGCLELKNVKLGLTEKSLVNVGSPEALDEQRRTYYSTPGKPAVCCINGADLEIAPAPDTAYTGEWSWYTRIPTLSGSVATNWLLTSHPDFYLYGALMHSAPFLKDDGRVQLWASAYDRVVASIQREDERATQGGSAPRSRFKTLG